MRDIARDTWKKIALALGSAILVGVIACGASAQGIVYVSEMDKDSEIYVVAPDSGDSAPVSRRPSSLESGPRWSPDGKRIAFVSAASSASAGDGNLDIFVASIDGGEDVRRLASQGGNEEAPLWTADGGRVAYVAEVDGRSDVYVVALESENDAEGRPARITTTGAEEFLGDWSPDGEWLVFSQRGNVDTQGLWLRNPNGVDLLRLTGENDLAPVWSPDGDAIAFVRNVEGNRDIYLLRAKDDDWREPVKIEPLIASPEADHSPAWAPDGDTLVYVSERDGNPEIYVYETDEDDPPQRLTRNEVEDSQPVWSPDGKRIAFVSVLHGESDIFAMDADGSNQQRLTHNDVKDHSPDW